jgi:uncharacterized membrane protein YphA (DoxX/SURF4 family)
MSDGDLNSPDLRSPDLRSPDLRSRCVKPEPNVASDLFALLTASGWPTAALWILLLLSCVIAFRAWRGQPSQRSARSIGVWLLRLVMGVMWWQQSLWKIPPNYDGLLYWMKQMVAHAAIPLQASLVDQIMIPNIAISGPLVYAVEVLIGVSLILGIMTRIASLFGLLMALNLWLGLYSAPNEWPWTYGYLIVIQALFVIDSPGRRLGLEGKHEFVG